MKPIHIFRAGIHTPMGGGALEFREADLAATAAAYDPALAEAPLVVGHPVTDAPAYGWVQALRADGGDLVAEPHQVEPAFAEMVQAGRFKKISASFYTPNHPANPKPGAFYLKHVGFLGAAAPAVKGLRGVSFAADDADVVTLEFAADGAGVSPWRMSSLLYDIGGLFRGLRDWMVAKEGLEQADKIMPATAVQRMNDEADRARVANVSLRLEIAGTKPAPVIGTDGLGSVLAEADRLLTAGQAVWSQYRYLRAMADFAIANFKASVQGIAGAIEGALANNGKVGAAAGSVSALASLNDAAIVSDAALPAALATAARDVSALAGGRAALTRGADAAPEAAFAALAALTSQELVAAPTSPATTPARQQLLTATEALGVLAAAMFAGEFARAAAAVPWASRDEAMAARDQVSDALAAVADRVAALGWDGVWQNLMALRAASATDLAQRAAPLPRIKRVELPGVMASTIIAYQLDGDSLSDLFGRAAALAARNRVRHPGFVPAAAPIEVLG